jgi:hypothetical protein
MVINGVKNGKVIFNGSGICFSGFI